MHQVCLQKTFTTTTGKNRGMVKRMTAWRRNTFLRPCCRTPLGGVALAVAQRRRRAPKAGVLGRQYTLVAQLIEVYSRLRTSTTMSHPALAAIFALRFGFLLFVHFRPATHTCIAGFESFGVLLTESSATLAAITPLPSCKLLKANTT